MPLSKRRSLFRRAPLSGGRAGLSAETLLLVTALFLALTANRPFLTAVLEGGAWSSPATWGKALALLCMVVGAHLFLLALLSALAPGRWIKVLLAIVLAASAAASYYMQAFGVVLDPSMMRNVMFTNPAEARELLTWGLTQHMVLVAVVPIVVLWWLPLRSKGWGRAIVHRSALALTGVLVFVVALMAIFPSFGPTMRNNKTLRYLVTPANLLWSTGAVVAQSLRGAAKPRQAIGLDAQPGTAMAARQQPGAKPLVVVLVVGETARAANWGLSGYSRNTTPELSAWPLISYAYASSCGTNTETSVPCMFAPVGRRDYDEDTIRGSESLLHVLARAGVSVKWLDNQSGCKGVCDGLPTQEVADLKLPDLCNGRQCLDEGLLAGLPEQLAQAKGTQFLVLHMLGNHGPAYYRRYPAAFERFKPACRTDDLQRCSQAEIVNAYDNALLYTDHVLAKVLAELKAARNVDSALIYVSDHGESLGEKNLYLHGLPYAIAPDVQTQVPMFMWFSDGAPRLDAACMKDLAAQAPKRHVAHDNLFHTLLAMLDVQTKLYEPDWDLLRPCRQP